MRPTTRHGALAAALALVLLAVARPAIDPSEARGLGRLPACRYDDIMTEPRGYDDWSTTLVDTILRVPKSYVPPDLVSVSKAGIAGHGRVRALVLDDLRSMTEAAAAAGNAIGVESAYRSYADQQATFASWSAQLGYSGALRVSARPGHSEHQLGLAIDFRSDPGGSPFSGSWGKTPAGKWMNRHAWEYGFIRSYPAGKEGISCYASEPWHYRYVGRDLAAAIHASGLTTREYLWANFTTAVVPRVTPKPTRAPRGTEAPAGSPPIEVPSIEPGPEASASPLVSESQATPPEPTQAPETDQAGSAAPNPLDSPPPVDASPVADLDPAVVAGLAAALIAVLAVTVLVLRRGRSGVGL